MPQLPGPTASGPAYALEYAKLTTEELATLSALNDALRVVTAKAKELGLTRTRELVSKLKDPENAVTEYSIRGTHLCESWKDLQVDALVPQDVIHRADVNLDFRKPGAEKSWEWDMEFFYDRPEAFQDINPIWLMHNLYAPVDDEGQQPMVTIGKALAIDKLELTVTTTEHFYYDITSRRWLKSSELFGDASQ